MAHATATADLRVGCLDRAMAAFDRRTSSWFHLIVDFDHPLDSAVLGRAWQALGTTFPILRAAGSLASGSPVWQTSELLPPVDHIVEDPSHRGLGPGPAELAALRDDEDIDEKPLSRLLLVDRADGPRLVWTCHHVLADGSSGIQVISKLAELYSACEAGRDVEPRADLRPRVVEELVARAPLDMATRSGLLARHTRRWNRQRHSAHAQPASVSGQPAYAAVDVTGALAAAAARRRHVGWRTSAVLLALTARAWERVFGDEPLSPGGSGWQVASDLRRVLGIDGGVGNFSATEPLTLHDVNCVSLEAVIDEANRELAGIESSWPGVGGTLSAMAIGGLPWPAFTQVTDRSLDHVASLRFGRSFSNVGPWPAAAETWGNAAVTHAFYIPTFLDPDFSVIAVQAVASRTWLSMRTHRLGVSSADVDALGQAMVEDSKVLSG